MNKRYGTVLRSFRGLVIAAAVTFSVASYAGWPLLALVEPAVEWAAGVIVQNGARQAIMTVGVAANDASWASLMGLSAKTAAILSLIGLGTAMDETRYEIPLQPNVGIPARPVVAPGSGALGSFDNPFPHTQVGLKLNLKSNANCQVVAANADDHVFHGIPLGLYDSWADLIAACVEVVKHSVGYTSPEPVYHFAGPGYPYEPFRFVIGGQHGDYFYTEWLYVQLVGVASFQYGSGVLEPVMDPPADGTKPFRRDVAGFYPDPDDADWTEAEIAAWPAGKTIQFRDAGNQSVVNVAATDAQTVITSATNASPNVQYRKVVLDADALPQSVVEGVAKDTNIDAVVEANTSTDPAVDPDPGTVVFPSDYARTGEAGAAADGIKTKLDVLHDDLTKTADAPADLIAPDASTFEDSFFKGAFADLLEWDLPSHTSTCPTAAINFDFFGQPFNVNMNAQCVILADPTVSNTAQTAFVVLWILVALFIVLGA